MLLILLLLFPDCPQGGGANRLPRAEGGGANRLPREVGANKPPARAMLLLALWILPLSSLLSKTGMDGIKAAVAVAVLVGGMGPLGVLLTMSPGVTTPRSDSRSRRGVAAILVNDKSMLVNLPPTLLPPAAAEEVALLPENEKDRCRPCNVMGAGGGRLGELPVGGANKDAKSWPVLVLLLVVVVVGAEDVCTDNLGKSFNGSGGCAKRDLRDGDAAVSVEVGILGVGGIKREAAQVAVIAGVVAAIVLADDAVSSIFSITTTFQLSLSAKRLSIR